jgi:hypothetical protein
MMEEETSEVKHRCAIGKPSGQSSLSLVEDTSGVGSESKDKLSAVGGDDGGKGDLRRND